MISIIIPTYQRYTMLYQAVQSVLKQTYQNIEIIVIDDCSGDDTPRIADISPKVIYLCNQQNSGPGYSRRRGLQHSHGDYVVFLDDDDYYTDYSFFQNAVTLLKNNPNYSFISANAIIRYEETGQTEENRLNLCGEISAADYLSGFPFRNKKPHSTFTTIFRKQTLLSVEVDKMDMLNDMPLYMRSLTSGGSVFFLKDEIGVYRIHSNNISKQMTPEFIIANLKEKAEVLSRVKQANLFDGYNSWWYQQIDITLGYYVYGSHPSFGAYNKVKQWCLMASEEKSEIRKLCKRFTAYLIDYRVCAVKRGIKNILGINQ